MIFCPLFSTRISFFQSFCVQDKTLWYIELIQLSDFLMHNSVSELLLWASKFNFQCPSYIIHSKVLLMAKNLILSQSSIKRANAQGIDTVVPAHKAQNF